ncbi:MAG: cytochrome c biogenesis heme-transporting ATPase CcmA [Gammaproteobacteria bacterium]|nr:cytochrome c biogenesis heme-transporting ATPase CcmA [Gammaproteobacteria bacterium]
MQAPNFSGLSARDIQVWRGERHVLRGVSLELAAGQVVHIAGSNGVGKTTLLRVLAGLLTAEQGGVSWQGRPVTASFEVYAATLAYLGHSDALKADFTARENLRHEVGLRRDVTPAEIDDALARVGLAGCRDLPARVLSAGQRRRLAMARVMLSAASLWILDEPFTNLDHVGVVLLSGVIAEQLDAGGAVIIAAHQPPAIPRHTVRCVELV